VKRAIDINSDLGEGTGLDAVLMPYLSSCNIACGGHFGNEESMRETVRLAMEHKVKIGAHPSFPDKDNFGRKIMHMTKEELTDSIFYQLLGFLAVCETEEAEVHHIKLHGALYNYAAIDAPTSDAVLEAITRLKWRPVLFVPYNSVLHRKAENLLPLKFEAFIDRRYTEEGQLVPRSQKGAVIEKEDEAWEQLWQMVNEERLTTITGSIISVVADTYCIHSDTLHSEKILKYIHKQLSNKNVEVT
jgi:UPF0271 protein